jgi:outer membrane protein TolC
LLDRGNIGCPLVLWDSDSVNYSFGPSIGWDIFNYGRIRNSVRVQDARFQELVTNYENTVLKAAQEAEDAIVSFLRRKEAAKYLAYSVEGAKRSVYLSLIQYREGLVDYQRVLDAQQSQSTTTPKRGGLDGNPKRVFV